MMRFIITLALGMVLLLSLTVLAVPLDLTAFCGVGKLELKTVAQLEALKQRVDADTAKCPPRVAEAITDLAAMVKDKQACRMDKAEAITRFVDKYLKQSPEEIPEALANFAVAYGMQVSRICSEEMVDGFASDADARIHNRLSPGEYKEFLMFKKHLVEESPVGLVLSSFLSTGELVLPGDLLQLTAEMGLREKLEIRLPENEQTTKFKGYCDNIMRPLYESALLPLAHLNRAGFNARARRRRSQSKQNSRFWSSVVFFCESLKVVEVVPNESLGDVKDLSDFQDMAVQLADQIGHEEEESSNVQLIADTPMEKYKSDQQVEGEILSNSVKALVKNFKANKSETERLRERLQSRSFRIFRALLKKAKYKPTMRKLIKMIKAKGKTNERISAAMSELVDSSEADWFATMAHNVDTDVSRHERKGEFLTLICLLVTAVFAALIIYGVIWCVAAICDSPHSYPLDMRD